jgi:hypothetical protein
MNSRFLFLLTLAIGQTYAAPAQTARIAHLSHAGSLETLATDAAADNFGLPDPIFIADSIKFLSDTTTLEYGKWDARGHSLRSENVRTYQFASRYQGQYKVSVKSYITEKKMYQPGVKILAYDTIPQAAPVLKKQKTKRKKSTFVPAVTNPPHPGVGGVVVAILLFAGAGWLLGDEAVPAQ